VTDHVGGAGQTNSGITLNAGDRLTVSSGGTLEVSGGGSASGVADLSGGTLLLSGAASIAVFIKSQADSINPGKHDVGAWRQRRLPASPRPR
jgi:hypothetical protein